MKKILVAGAFLIFTSAFADTPSERIAKQMVAVLQSVELAALLSQTDGVGNIDSIKYISTLRATFGPSLHEVSFKSNSGPVPQLCKVSAKVDIQTLQLLELSSATCVEISSASSN